MSQAPPTPKRLAQDLHLEDHQPNPWSEPIPSGPGGPHLGPETLPAMACEGNRSALLPLHTRLLGLGPTSPGYDGRSGAAPALPLNPVLGFVPGMVTGGLATHQAPPRPHMCQETQSHSLGLPTEATVMALSKDFNSTWLSTDS